MGERSSTIRNIKFYLSLGEDELARDDAAGTRLGYLIRHAVARGWIERTS